MTDDLIIRTEKRVGRISLNRPSALHALNLPMCLAMLAALDAWWDDPAVDAVLLDHNGGRGFCAGADIRRIALEGSALGRPFFAAEYRLNLALFDFPKPVIAIMDGIVMGGGAGLALPAQFRVATERTLFAMPETGIGLIPDVGGGWHMPRLPGEIGTWLSLTGARLGGPDCLALGLATHLVESDEIDRLKADIIAGGWFPALAASPAPPSVNQASIDLLFAHDRVEDILAALIGNGSDWASQQLVILQSRCPTSLKATLRHLRLGRDADMFAQVLELEYRLCTRLVDRHDFREGVRAAVIDKDRAPAWTPDTLAAVGNADLDALFAPLPPGQSWAP
jgi:enoyl-CoA hydratase